MIRMKLREKMGFLRKKSQGDGTNIEKKEKEYPVVEKYLSEVGGQMRSSLVKQSVLDELAGHIHEQAEVYLKEGEEKEAAYERAVKEMGDPVDVGISFDKIHRPHMEWHFLLIIAGFSLFSLLLKYILQEAGDAHDVYFPDYCVHLFVSLFAMFFMYRIDYSFIRGKSICLAAGFLLFALLLVFLNGIYVNGASYYVLLPSGTFHGVLTITHFFPLYLPVFAGVLYDLRGKKGWKAVPGIFVFSVFPVIYTYGVGDNAMTVVLFLSELVLLVTAAKLGWYTFHKKNALFAAGGVLAGILVFFFTIGKSVFSGYHLMRLQVWLNTLSGRDDAYNIATDRIKNIFRISVMQKNQLGRMMGISCGVVLLAEAFVNLGMAFRFLPFSSGHLPFLSHGGTSLIVSYALLGIVLSIFRYKDILEPEKTVVKEPFQPSV